MLIQKSTGMIPLFFLVRLKWASGYMGYSIIYCKLGD